MGSHEPLFGADVLDVLTPGGALQGPIFDSLLDRLLRAPTEIERGARIGAYRVLDKLGEGGMAVVYLAERADGEFEQRVALKLVTPEAELDSQEARELLRRERQILARLEHPRIARLLDGGTTDAGALWFAMEAVSGERIDRWCETHNAGRRLRLGLLLQVCDAVQFAHARLLVHRDLKPSNILVTDAGEVKLLDFGIAAVVQPGHEHATPRALTPGYASPEQRRGEIETTASDVWQLGRLLETLVMQGIAAGAAAPADLTAIIARACEDEPSRRYPSVAALADDVQRHLDARPVLARNAGPAYRVQRFLARHRVSSAIAGLALIALVALGSTLTAQLTRERDAATREAGRANAAVQFLVGLFRSSDPSSTRGQPLDVRILLARGEERLARELHDEPAVRARLMLAIAQIHDSMGDAVHATALLDETLQLARSFALDRSLVLDASLTRAEIALHVGRPLDVLAQLARVEPQLTPADEDRTSWLRLWSARAMAQLGSGDLTAAEASERRALAVAIDLDGPDGAEAAAREHDLGIVLRARGDYRAAAVVFEHALVTYARVYGETHPQYTVAQKSLGGALLALGELDRAEPLLLSAIERFRVLYDGRGATYGHSLRIGAQLKSLRGDHAGALVDLRESVRLIEQALGPESAALAYARQDLGDARAALGDAAGALGEYRRALAIRRVVLPADHPEVANSLSQIAMQLWRLGDGAGAEAAATEAWRMRLARKGAQDVATLRSQAVIGLARALQGDAAGAERHFAEVHALAPPAHAAMLEQMMTTPEQVVGLPPSRVAPIAAADGK